MAKEDGVNSLRVSGHHFGSIVPQSPNIPYAGFLFFREAKWFSGEVGGAHRHVAYGDMALSFHKLDQLIWIIFHYINWYHTFVDPHTARSYNMCSLSHHTCSNLAGTKAAQMDRPVGSNDV